MSAPRVASGLYGQWCRPKLAELLACLGLDAHYHRARGAWLYRQDADGGEVPVLDLVGGFGAGLLGHNHPELKALMTAQLDADVPFLAQSSLRVEAGRLAERLSAALPGSSDYRCHLANSGAEAMETALKHAYKVRFDALRRQFDGIARAIETFHQETERAWPDIEIPGGARDLGRFRDDLDEHNLAALEQFLQGPVVLAFKGAFHGKTATALKVTFNRSYREGFEGLSAVRPVFLGPDDVDRLADIEREARIAFLVPRVDDGRIVVERVEASRIIAFCLEVIQGEGGIRLLGDHVLTRLAELHGQLGIPLVVDEIQTGCGRTGTFVAYAATPLAAIEPEYVTLSKALGGGLVKVAATLIRADVYDPDFGILHTSTFAEDELGCAVARRVVDLLTREDGRVMREVAAKGAYLLAGLRALQERYPDVIREVRGRGLMIGIEFTDLADKSPLFRFGIRQGFLSLLVASYLLHHRHIRLLAPLTTLLKGNPGRKRHSVLRIQPAVDITVPDMDDVLDALDEVCGIIARNHEGLLVAHLLNVPVTPEERRTPVTMPVTQPASARQAEFDARVGFVVHPAHVDQVLRYYFPTLAGRVHARTLAAWWSRLARFLDADVIHTAYIAADGFVVEANVVAIPYLPADLLAAARCLGKDAAVSREGQRFLQEVTDRVQDAVTTAKELGDDHIPTSIVGLGAFTSIVTDRGLTVNDFEVPITTGNAYTAGLMIEGIERAAELQHRELGSLRAAVVGAAGNIGSVLAALLSLRVARLRLVGRDAPGGRARLAAARRGCLQFLATRLRAEALATGRLEDVRVGGLGDRLLDDVIMPALRRSGGAGPWHRAEAWLRGRDEAAPELVSLLEAALDLRGGPEGNDYLSLHVSVEAIADCQVVTVATNSTEGQLVTPALVPPGAIVSCASVPSNLSLAFKDHLADYLVFDGGYARLPAGQSVDCIGLPRDGQAFGCFSETVLLGLEGVNASFARGPISPAQVEATLQMAERFGFGLGEFKLNEASHPLHAPVRTLTAKGQVA